MTAVPLDHVRLASYETKAIGSRPCLRCGRDCGDDALVLRIVDAGSTLTDDAVGPFDPAEDLGWHDIGPDCAAKVRKATGLVAVRLSDVVGEVATCDVCAAAEPHDHPEEFLGLDGEPLAAGWWVTNYDGEPAWGPFATKVEAEAEFDRRIFSGFDVVEVGP